MCFDRPLLILAVPRGGSSLTANIFEQHGFWVGEWRTKAPYPTYENHAIKRFLETHYWPEMTLGEPTPVHVAMKHDLASMCRSVVPRETKQWLFKGGAIYVTAWLHWFPNAYLVCLKRDYKQTLASHIKIRGESERERSAENIRKHFDLMDLVLDRYPGQSSLVVSDDILAGDYSGLEPALDHYGIALDKAAIQRVVKPERWHWKGVRR